MMLDYKFRHWMEWIHYDSHNKFNTLFTKQKRSRLRIKREIEET